MTNMSSTSQDQAIKLQTIWKKSSTKSTMSTPQMLLELNLTQALSTSTRSLRCTRIQKINWASFTASQKLRTVSQCSDLKEKTVYRSWSRMWWRQSRLSQPLSYAQELTSRTSTMFQMLKSCFIKVCCYCWCTCKLLTQRKPSMKLLYRKKELEKRALRNKNSRV